MSRKIEKSLSSIDYCVVSILCLLLMSVLFLKYGEKMWENKNTLIINNQSTPLHVVSPNFLSIAFDTVMVKDGIADLHFDSRKFAMLASELSPAYLRVGGTQSDNLTFNKDSHEGFNAESWEEINKWCERTKLNLVFSLNVLLRDQNNNWNSDNAEELFGYSSQRGYKVNWQLGNEPNSFAHKFNISVGPRQLASDFRKLRQHLNNYGLYRNALMIGPDTTRPQPHNPSLKYMEDFLDASANVDVISWHQYYLNGRTATLDDFWSPDTLDLLKKQISEMLAGTDMYRDGRPMWLSETSSAYGGGAAGLSDTYASSPMWLDKLGLAARWGISVVMRQSLLGGHYSLIGPDLEPHPDWWVSWIHKKLIGVKILDCASTSSVYQRLYCACGSEKYCVNCIVIYGLNLENDTKTIQLSGTALGERNFSIDAFVFTAESRDSSEIYINNVKMQLNDLHPNVKPVMLKNTTEITLLPYSVGFWVVRDIVIKACKNNL